MLDLNQRPKDSGLYRFPYSLDYLTTLARISPFVRVPGARGMLIGLAPRTLVSAPSHLPILRSAFSELGSGLPGQQLTDGFPEFTRFFHHRFHGGVTISMSPLL